MARHADFDPTEPLFVKRPFRAGVKIYNKGEEYPWLTTGVEHNRVLSLYASGFLHHNEELKNKSRTGDRLIEFDTRGLIDLVAFLNSFVKRKAQNKTEYERSKCKSSKLEDRQRTLIRQFLRNNQWLMEEFEKYRDGKLAFKDKAVAKAEE